MGNSFLLLSQVFPKRMVTRLCSMILALCLFFYFSDLKLPWSDSIDSDKVFLLLGSVLAYTIIIIWYSEGLFENKLTQHIRELSLSIFFTGAVFFMLLEANLISDFPISPTYLLITVTVSGFLSFILSIKRKNSYELLPKQPKVSRAAKDYIRSGLLPALILTLGMGLIIYGALKQNLHVDEALTSLVAKNITEGLLPLLDSGIFYARGYLYTYPLALIYALFDVNVLGTRILSVIASFFSIIFFHYIAQKVMGNRALAIIATATFTLLPITIQFSNFARMYSFNLLIQLAIIALLIHFLQNRKPLALLWSLPIFFLGFLNHNLFIFTLIPFVLSILFIERKRIVEFICNRKLLAFSLLVLGAIFSLFGLIYLSGSTKVDVLSNIRYTGAIFDIFLNQYSYLAIPFLIVFSATIFEISQLFAKKKSDQNYLILSFNLLFSLFLIEILIFSNFPSYRIRYIYHLIPLLIILYASRLPLLSYKSFVNHALAGVIVVFGLISLDYSSLENRPVPSYESLKSINLDSSDIVITNNPIVTKFYLNRADYWLMPNENEIFLYSYLGSDSKTRYVYTDSEVISTENQLAQILTENHGVLIIDPFFANFLGNTLVQSLTGKTIGKLPQDYITLLRF